MGSNTVIEIGARIAEQRKKLRMTQKELSEKLRVKRETINQWENGSRQIKGSDLADLTDALGTTCDYILRGVSPENIPLYRDIGLSDDAVYFLKELSRHNAPLRYKSIIQAINALLSEKQFEDCSKYWERLYAFLFTSDTPFRAYIDSMGEINFDAESVLSILLRENENYLIALRKEHTNNG